MNIVRKLREQANVTQEELARKAGTSQSAIAAYETGAKSPTLRTLEKLAAALNLELAAQFVPKLSREEKRSLAYHQAVVTFLQKNPKESIRCARKNLEQLRSLHPHAFELINRWDEWLDLPLTILIKQITEISEDAHEMRQVSPFAGFLSAEQRKAIIVRLRLEQAA
ncbi:MAG: helix-turn-helix domain-containing protein [Pseudomonadales bacterium]